ncbi:hypothetical protein Tco_0772267 [Tanacetum coccineum]|uniref:Uncharacterized protein n=1 Tax=Tanacetum coccineum TaxID=301880 RepID=A0ABQ4ZIT2_9ASTR
MYLTAFRPDIMFVVCARIRFQVTSKVSHLYAVKRIFRYLKGQPKLGLWYPKDSPFDLEAYTDSDYAGASLDRKSTTGGCQFLGRRLISWQCKKQTIVANSTTEAEYIFIDNESTICIVKNPVFHSKTKHIEIRHHFIRDSYEKRLIQVIKIHTDHNVADLLTKAFDVSRFQYLIANVTVIKEWEDKMERVVTATSSLEAEQDSGNINRTQSMGTLNESFPQGTDSGSGPRCQDTILGVQKLKLDKPEESEGFEQIIDFLNASSVRYALTIQALVDGKKVILTKTSVRRALHLKDAKGTDWLSTAIIFAELERIGAKTTAWNEFSSTMASAIICLATNQIFNFSKYIFNNMVKNVEGGVKILMYPRFVQVFLDKQVDDMSKHKEIYVTPSHTKKIFANMKREGKGFSGRITPLFQTMMVQAPEEVGEGSVVPTNSHHTTTQPSTSRPQKKHSRRKQRKDSGPTEPITDEATNEEHVSTPSYDPSQSGKDRMQLNELMDLCAKLSNRVLALENTNTSQASEIATLKERVKKLEKKRMSRTYKPRRLYKGRKITDLDADTKVTLIDENQGRNDKDLMFDTGILNSDEVFQEPIVNTATKSSIPDNAADPVTTAGEVVITASVEIPEELTLAQTLMEIKSAKPNAVSTVATTVTPASSRSKAKGIVFHDQEEQAPSSTPIEMFDKEMKRVNTFVDMDIELVKGCKTKAEGSFKRAGEELESNNSKKQRINEHVEAKGDDDQEEEEIKKLMEIVQDDEVAIDAIPLAIKPPVIVEWKIIKEGKMEDLETLWKLVKAKHRNTRPEEAYERVLWGDLKVMFEPDIESEVRRSLEGHNVTVWKLFSSSGVHFVRFKDLHIFMLVEKKYPLTPATITGMLNKKLQVDQWNEMSYQLLKLLVKQQKNIGISAAYTKVNAAGMKVTTAERLQLLEEFLLSEG